jgi:hypothetical protein
MTAINLHTVGKAIEERFGEEIALQPLAEYAGLRELRNLTGEHTGYIKVYGAPRLVKASFLSIRVGPGRYFNIHVIPDPGYDVPRFLYEGMLMPMGSQLSMDLFPDKDVVSGIRDYLSDYAPAIRVYDEARRDPQLRFEPSRQAHMRTFASPLFLCAFAVTEERLSALERYAHGYLDAWLTMYDRAAALSPDEAQDRVARRAHMSRVIIEQDPDRHRVVEVYGEAMTQAIEAASML